MSNPCTPTNDKDPDQGGNQGGPQGTIAASSKHTLDDRPSGRQRLDCMSSFRIRFNAIKFTPGDSLKKGGKADVAQAKFRSWYSIRGQLVAVKKLRSIHTKKARDEFIYEVETMKGLSHKNIVQFIGFVEELENGTAWMILPWEPNGNVSEFLAKGDWEIPERVSLIKDTFEGIRYLHTRQPPLCHGNLKSFNILVNSSNRAVITGFGSARAISEPEDEAIGNESGEKLQGNPPAEQACPPIHIGTAGNQLTLTGPAWALNWEAPEVMDGKRLSLSSDIWAAGWVCWEVMTDSVPFAELDSAGMISLTVTRTQGEDSSPRDDEQLGPPGALNSLMTDCWAFDPKARPSISQCCNELQWMPSTPPSGGNLSGPKVASTNVLLQKGRMHSNHGNYEKSGVLFQRALSLARSAGNRTATADALVWVGATYRSQSKYAQAEESYTQAQEIYARVGNEVGRADTLIGLGGVYRDKSIFSKAEESYTRAQEICARTGSDLGLANALFGMGDIYRVQSKYTLAEELYIQAQQIYTRIGNDLGRATALDMLGLVYHLQLRFTQAEESYIRAQEFYARIGNDLGRANTLYGLGQLYHNQSRYTHAEESYTQAQGIYARLGNDHCRANNLHGIGHLCRSLGRNAEAATHYTEARDLFVQIGITREVQDVSHWLAVVASDHHPPCT
ncbi:hypothetical protein M407DRAFT_26605 [Tulasnella calospora MUT 4182]|uniref:Protein kinase domain-containing protein n=1 Tax=Tulasnella calospora MUT 4182 TaxID=1051891 RepID=A0A0C3Q4Q4_9AGAM|nr:hypothetical protein M407DRAFT_26605 [Tulasnella calospora MUT 4182]